MRKRAKLTTAIFLAASVNVSYGGENCLPPDAGMNDPMKIFECFQGMLDTQQQQIGELTAENQALKNQLNQKLPANAENCSAEQQGQIGFDGTYARLCNGKNWQIVDARNSKPVLKASAKQYTIAEVQATAKDNAFGQGTVCETGYHICIFMEALSLKYAYPRSRIAFEGEPLRTLGNRTNIEYSTGTHEHNSLLGYKRGDWWNGPNLQCPDGSGPMIHFFSKSNRSKGEEWDGGCHKDSKHPWACCINNLD